MEFNWNGALARIEAGWCKNTFEDDDGNVCARGAILKELQGPRKYLHYRDAWDMIHARQEAPYAASFAAIIKEEYPDWEERFPLACPDDGDLIATFNNAEDTTKEDVVRIFQKVAANA